MVNEKSDICHVITSSGTAAKVDGFHDADSVSWSDLEKIDEQLIKIS